MNTWAENLFQYYSGLQPPQNLPGNIQWLYPQKDPAVLALVKKFLWKYYNDTKNEPFCWVLIRVALAPELRALILRLPGNLRSIYK